MACDTSNVVKMGWQVLCSVLGATISWDSQEAPLKMPQLAAAASGFRSGAGSLKKTTLHSGSCVSSMLRAEVRSNSVIMSGIVYYDNEGF